jgi:hypothetical protein
MIKRSFLFEKSLKLFEARDYLAIPGTSASSERLFTSGKLMITETRSRLSASTIQACQCLLLNTYAPMYVYRLYFILTIWVNLCQP